MCDNNNDVSLTVNYESGTMQVLCRYTFNLSPPATLEAKASVEADKTVRCTEGF